MPLVIKQNRNFECKVPVSFLDESAKIQKAEFTAVFRTLKSSEVTSDDESKLIEKILVSVKGLSIQDEDGNEIDGEDLVNVVKEDLDLGAACVEVYLAKIQKGKRGKKI